MKIDKVKCPGCDGRGERNAMSGAHLPHTTVCDDCRGHGLVPKAKADEIVARHKAWESRK